jgi:BirA family biotin operon repressor/biotin-[acetyl-CoA-carboxylase] ligase
MSIVLFPPPHLAPTAPEAEFGCAWLTALGALATAEVVADWTGRDARIKWPNDVRVNGRKIAGILVERAWASGLPGYGLPPALACEPGCGVIVGIGVNVNLERDAFPLELGARATSIQIERSGVAADRSLLARDLIGRLDHWYDTSRSRGAEALNEAWRAHSEHIGRIVRVATPSGVLVGRLVDLDLRRGLTLDVHTGADPRPPDERARSSTRLPLADILALSEDAHDRHDRSDAQQRLGDLRDVDA